MHTLDELELLARHWSNIFGKALDPSTSLGPRKELALHESPLDANAVEIQQALRGLQRLQQLSDEPKQRWAAEALFYAHVRCGSELRRSGEVYLTLGLGKKKRPTLLTEEKRRALIAKGLRRYDLACSLFLENNLLVEHPKLP